ncbi:hypothetical protein [Pseudomonas baetica]|uniref:hypothetical protein n=1 Tax=Pseudomonas baetica TaxID=674054 RepID=UPI002406CAD1|nr:hypothetical protein [Pseudomonas baetica]MDF9775713.1 hypothetical protein [Pseudomonas baetica]
MNVNDNAGNLTPHGVLGFIASKLAPTVRRVAPACNTGANAAQLYALVYYARACRPGWS